MAELWNKTKNIKVLDHLQIATKFIDRGVGLLKFKEMSPQQGLWIHQCNSIHTFFMRFTIDCVFVDNNLIVKSVHENVKPWRLIIPQWGASSVFELAQGMISTFKIQKGDQLNVVS
ncbi:MAG: DUF192 domain-containing protein [Bdellovibrionales bacterium]|nr:DUF192 domain-containing protein [Bdellovibrionales bacterium]